MFPLIQLPRKSEAGIVDYDPTPLKPVSINSTSEEVRSQKLTESRTGDRKVSINSTSEEVRSKIVANGSPSLPKFPLIQLPRKSEDFGV